MRRREFLGVSMLALSGCVICGNRPPQRKLSMNASTIRGYKLSLKDQVKAVAAAGFGGFEPWLKDIHAARADGTFALRPDMRAYDRRTCDRHTFPAETILARGFAVMSCCFCQISPDIQVRLGDPLELAWTGVFDLWGPHDPADESATTSLGAWAWALSRGLDLAERQPEIDAARAVVTGSSRLGKAALLAGMEVSK